MPPRRPVGHNVVRLSAGGTILVFLLVAMLVKFLVTGLATEVLGRMMGLNGSEELAPRKCDQRDAPREPTPVVTATLPPSRWGRCCRRRIVNTQLSR